MPPKRQRNPSVTAADITADPLPSAKRRATRSSTRSAVAAEEVEQPSEEARSANAIAETKPAIAVAKNPERNKKVMAAKPEKKAPATTEKEEKQNGGELQRRFWLMKAEPESRIEKGKDVKFSIDDLAACKEPQGWDGVRNYGARNNLKAMKEGDLAFFYHSNCKEPGIVGIIRVVQEASVDTTAFDPNEPYYDPKSSPDAPKWYLVHVEFVRKFRRLIGLQELKTYANGPLATMPLLKQGRLSVSEVPKECWDFILGLEDKQ